MKLQTQVKRTWCPGCGNYAILSAFISAVKELKIEPEKLVVVSGIGCHGRITDYVNVNSFHTIHGRVLPLATGIKIANPELIVVGFSGDGDAYSIGLGHLPHAARRNVDITLVIHNNQVFGLTTGQYTPTSPKGFKSRSTPYGSLEEPLNPVLLAIASGATFVARGFAGDINHLKYLMKEAITHKGFAIIDVLQPCVTYYNTYQYYSERVYKLENHDSTNFREALEKALEWNDKIPIGIFYKVQKPLAYRQARIAPAHRTEFNIDVTKLYSRFR
ncbi:MAG: 2-oxoacid:ferredoxin oxidoreductase subunit beta [Thermofilum sp. ex4484_82]|nr:MAG: 2-oxoacid:ferredoxin oxidoreductase subunit beta [Thermofilum sp. ex4484_82]OYT39952.1 MAG: 2-oxoacid:ferredoxin oxidoreductase subunit beta [Archaeoglobales archaeon ex4484_92]